MIIKSILSWFKLLTDSIDIILNILINFYSILSFSRLKDKKKDEKDQSTQIILANSIEIKLKVLINYYSFYYFQDKKI